MAFSSMVGPVEEISFYGHPLAYIAPSVYGHPHVSNLITKLEPCLHCFHINWLLRVLTKECAWYTYFAHELNLVPEF